MNMLTDIAFPTLLIAAVAGLAPYFWARILAEGVPGLVLNAVLSAGLGAVAAHFWRYGLDWPGAGAALRWQGLAAIIWVPVLILAVAQQPRRWKTARW